MNRWEDGQVGGREKRGGQKGKGMDTGDGGEGKTDGEKVLGTDEQQSK